MNQSGRPADAGLPNLFWLLAPSAYCTTEIFIYILFQDTSKYLRKQIALEALFITFHIFQTVHKSVFNGFEEMLGSIMAFP